ncbi:MAG: alpha/beta hydrolase [Deltaproteobacteria bacterium]|nr:alpha/beta hydrolase [Deltaproteobacteria bacterium]
MQQQIQFPNCFGEKLAGTFHAPPEDSRRGIILGHCFTCSRHTRILRDVSLALVTGGFKVLRFDFSGNGQSEGSFSESSYSKQIAEMNSAASFMSADGVSWLGLAGHSMGAMVALLAAAEINKVRAVCTLAAKATALHTTHFLNESQLQELQSAGQVHFASRGRDLELTQAFFDDATKYELSNIMPSLLQPWLIVHGDQDEVIPMKDAHRLYQYRPVNTELVIITGADHMFSQDKQRQEVTELVVKWFKKLALKDGFGD